MHLKKYCRSKNNESKDEHPSSDEPDVSSAHRKNKGRSDKRNALSVLNNTNPSAENIYDAVFSSLVTAATIQ